MARRSRRQIAGGQRREIDHPQQHEQRTVRTNRSVAPHVRERQRAVAEREASRLARPERRLKKKLGHADRKKSAVSSTPFGILTKRDKDDAQNSGNHQEWCGPFSVARQMIAEREEELRRREAEQEESLTAHHPLDQIMEELDMERKRKSHPSLQWKGKASQQPPLSTYAKRQKRVGICNRGCSVPALFDLCVNFLVENFEHVESLGNVENSIRVAITKELVANSKMNGDSFQSLVDLGMEALEMVDCAEISQEQLSTSLKELLPAGLRYLVLDQAGRCFGGKAVDAIVSSSGKANLFALSVGGAYLLTDENAALLVKSISKTASSLEFKACPNLGMSFCKSISDSFASSGELLELSFEDLSLKSDCLEALIAKPDIFRKLKSLSMRRIEGLDDSFIAKFLKISGSNLEGLDLSHNYSLSDLVLSAIRTYCPQLRALSLSEVKHLTPSGLEAFFTHVPGMAPPPMLTTLNLACCDHEAVTDELVHLITQAATKKRDGSVDQLALLGGLVQLNIQGSSLVTDTTMECLAATCATSLQYINISFCPRISDKGLGYLIDTVLSQLSKVEIWGCAQLTDEFFDGHSRVDDRNLKIVGTWMKKNFTQHYLTPGI